MRVPAPPSLPVITSLSYSRYEAGRKCLARLAWASTRDKPRLPEAPGAILGTAFHAVMREAHRGTLGQVADDAREHARKAFDAAVSSAWLRAHPLVVLKFREPRRLPYYNMRREQAAALAAQAASKSAPASEGDGGGPGKAERWLSSIDRSLVGQADLLDRTAEEIVDYKTGHAPPASNGAVSDSEQRQLRFYAHLAAEERVSVKRGVIIRADGRRAEIAISNEDAAEEGRRARSVLTMYRDAAAEGRSFADLATPRAESCTHCECIPFCEPFWAAATAAWAADCGTHVEGIVTAVDEARIHGARLVTLRVTARRGTFSGPEAQLELLPAEWLEVDGAAGIVEGSVVRIVHASVMSDRAGVVRADRAATLVWLVS